MAHFANTRAATTVRRRRRVVITSGGPKSDLGWTLAELAIVILIVVLLAAAAVWAVLTLRGNEATGSPGVGPSKSVVEEEW